MRSIIPTGAKLVPPQAQPVFKGIIFDVYQWQQTMFDGSTETFEMLKRPDTVKILAIKDQKLVILEQEQPDHPLFFDLPGGRHDIESETELEAAQRELLEETGLRFKTWRLLEVTQPAVKIESFVYVWLATDFESQTEPHLDAGEKITVRLLSLHEVKQLAKDPKARYLPQDILDQVNSLEDLLALPEFAGQSSLD